MQNKVKEIALRVKELRELSGITPLEMAHSIDWTEGAYTAFEGGNEDISASRLHEIAQKLGVDLALLLTGKTPRMNVFAVTRKGEGVAVERRKQYQYEALAYNFTSKKVESFVVTVPVTEASAAITLNSHPGQEMDYILEGSLKVVICGNELILNPGDSIYYDSSYPHGMAAIGAQPARFLAIIM